MRTIYLTNTPIRLCLKQVWWPTTKRNNGLPESKNLLFE